MNWKNRIVGTADVAPDQLLANPGNWAIHPSKQQDALEAVLGEIGWVGGVMISKNSGFVIDGHARIKVAARNNQETVPVFYVDLTEEEEKKILATYDMITRLRVPDEEKLAELLEDLELSPALSELRYEFADLEGLDISGDGDEPPEDPGAQIDKADELREKWQTETGQLWQLGDHRVICGDCTDAAVVERLMGDEKAQMVFTDPPYAIYGSSTGISNSVADDKMILSFFRDILNTSKAHSKPYAHIYTCCDWRSWRSWMDVAARVNLPVKNCIVWDKGDGGLGGMFQQCHEFIAFFTNDPHNEKMFKGKGVVGGQRVVHGVPNIWRAGRVTGEERAHNASKPVELIEVAVGTSSDEGGIVADWFVGGGSTVIAAERLGRACYGIEIEPKYIAVTLERWHEMTGLTPELVELP